MIFSGEDMPRNFGDEYDNHKVFSYLKDIMAFYDTLSYSNYTPVDYASIASKSKILNTAPYIYSSLAGTIESIYVLLHNGRCNDAMSLVRKYCDSIILEIYIRILVKEIRNNVLEESFLDYIQNNAITKWIDAESRLLDEKDMKTVFGKISTSFPALTDLFQLRDSKALYRKLRDLCNDNLHNNYLYTIIANDTEMIRGQKRLRSVMMNNIFKSLSFFFSIHFAFIYCGDSNYMMSSDYIDYLDCGSQPPEGSERWVAPSVATAFDIVKNTVPNVADYLISLDIMDI